MPPMQNFSNAFGDPAELQAYLARKAAGGGRPPGAPPSQPQPAMGMMPFPGGSWDGGGKFPSGGGMTPPWANPDLPDFGGRPTPGGGMARYLDSGYKPPWMSEQLDAPPPAPGGFEDPGIASRPDIVNMKPENPGLVSKPGPGLLGKPAMPSAGGVMRQPGKPGAAMGARPPVRPMPGKPAGGVNSNPFAQAGGAPAAPTSPPQPGLGNPAGGQAGRIQALLARIRSSGQGGGGMAA
jgi:hypothetical protein